MTFAFENIQLERNECLRHVKSKVPYKGPIQLCTYYCSNFHGPVIFSGSKNIKTLSPCYEGLILIR